MRVAALQLTSSDQPDENARMVAGLARDAAAQGAEAVFTPEVTNCVSLSRSHQRKVLRHEKDDATLAALREVAADRGIFVHVGSLALLGEDDRFANRGFVISPEGEITARYDKIHMFDVSISETETFRESEAFAPGERAVVTEFGGMRLGLSICYDLRFAALYRSIARAGADVLAVPAAFSPETGEAHWEILLRARAIETGAYVIAAAQTGLHRSVEGRQRRTWGHSMIVAPWGEVIAMRARDVGIVMADIDPDEVRKARRRVPSLTHDREFQGP